MSDCLFCKIVYDEEPAHKLWANQYFLAFLSIHPVNPGHTLLVTRQHVEYIFDLREPLYTMIFQVARQLAKPIKAATKAKRIGVAIEGLSVSHLHIHLIPINNVGEVDPHRHVRMSPEELFEVAEEIRTRMRKDRKDARR